MVVYVLDKCGKPLMPTERCGWVAYALKHGEAKVVRREPFTIQLLRDSTDYLQAVTLGVDVGSRHIGLSATTERKELYSAQVELRDDVSKLLTARREFRSIWHKADSHVRAVLFVCKILPIKYVEVETGKFDIHRIKNDHLYPWQYQQGSLFGWENLKAYAKWRDGYKCRACGKSKHKDGVRLEVHHIRRMADGGTDTPDNVVTLCEDCHKAHHQGERELKFRRPPQHKGEAHMNAMKDLIMTRLKHEHHRIGWRHVILLAHETYGYLTAIARREHGIEKSHANDAFCIAGNFKAERNTYNRYLHKFVRRHNRCLHKSIILKGGIRKANQCPREVFGFRLNDRVRYAGKNWFVHGRRARGSFVLTDLGMTDKAEVSYRKIRLIHIVGTQLTERRMRNSSQT